jgi:PB1 domain
LNESLITDARGFASTAGSPSYGSHGIDSAVFKLTDPSGHTHRIRSELKVSTLLDLLVKKMGDGVDTESIRMKFLDDEGDAVMITSNECLAEAAQLAQKSGNEVVKLTVTIVKPKTPMNDNKSLILAGVGAVIAIGAVALLALRPRSA